MGSSRLAATVCAGLCVAVALYLTGQRGDATKVQRANELGAGGHYAAAADAVRGVTGRPAAVEAATVRGRALLAAHRPADAERVFAQALRDAPKSWQLHRDRAVALEALGRRMPAGRELSLALSLNPRMPLPAGFTVSGLAREPR